MDTIEIISELLVVIMTYAVIFGIPAASLIWFVVSFIRYLKVPKSEKELRKERQLPLIVSAIVFAVLLFSILAIFILFTMSLSHM